MKTVSVWRTAAKNHTVNVSFTNKTRKTPAKKGRKKNHNARNFSDKIYKMADVTQFLKEINQFSLKSNR